MLVSIITPVYNRHLLLERLYESLLNQTLYDFEWLIIDDGSSDELPYEKEKYLDSPFRVKYFRKENGGKHTALNLGIEKAEGEWVFVVDSDDYLDKQALEKISEKSKAASPTVGGLLFLKAYPTMQIVGEPFKSPHLILHSPDLVKIKGDKAYVVKRRHVGEIRFPEFDGEKFVTEAYVWNQLFDTTRSSAQAFNDIIYMGEYLPGGLSDNYLGLLKRNPLGTMAFVKSNLMLNTVTNDIIKQAAYHFSPIMSFKNLWLVRKEIALNVYLRFLIISLVMKLKLFLVRK